MSAKGDGRWFDLDVAVNGLACGRISIARPEPDLGGDRGTSPNPGLTLWDSDMDINQFDAVLLLGLPAPQAATPRPPHRQTVQKALDWSSEDLLRL